MLAENQLKQIQPDRLHIVEQETPVRMLGEVALRKNAVAYTMEAPVAGTSRVGKAARLSQDCFHFLELDAVPEDLDLTVDPPQILERSASRGAKDTIAGEIPVPIAWQVDKG